MTPEQETKWREEFESEFASMDFSKQIGNENFYCYSEINQYWNVWKAARKKAKEETDALGGIKKYPTALGYISELREEIKECEKEISQLKEELKLERLFSSKIEIQSIKGYPTPKEWSDLTSENMKTKQQRRIEL